MSTSNASVTYEQLAELYERRGEARQRDLFLALAADAALQAGNPGQAERCRQRLLQLSPYHLLRPYPTFADSLQSPDVVDYLTDLRSQYPPDRAARLVAELRGGGSPEHADPASSIPSLRATLVGAPPRSSPPLTSRRAAVSPYEDGTPLSRAHPEGPTLTWVPGLLFLIVLFLGLAWGVYVLAGPFLD